MGRKRRQSLPSDNKDYIEYYNTVYNLWLRLMYNMAYTSIIWRGQPFYPEACVPERWLIDQGFCVAFVDDVLGFMLLPANPSSSLNPVGMPSEYQAYSQNGGVFNHLVPDQNCVLICGNASCTPEINIIRNYALRMTERQIAQTVNLNANKTPTTIITPDELRLTAENLYNGYNLGKPVIIGNDNLDLIKVQAIATGAPFIVDALSIEMRAVWSEFLTWLGVPSMDVSKRERLLKDEVAQAMGGAVACRAARMPLRRIAADKILEMFGIDMQPEYAVDIEPTPDLSADAPEDIEIEEVE